MKKFILHTCLFFTPFLIPVILYLIIDPFKVIYKYPEQINTNKSYQITGNRDFQSTQLFLWNYKKYDYNSFIFGNSRSMFYQVSTWNTYIHGNCFHFNASSESLYGVYCKLRFLDERSVDIKNALIFLDTSLLKETKNSYGHLFIKHPALSKESYLSFHKEMFFGFFPKAMFAYTDLFLTDRKKDYMSAFGIGDNLWKHDMITNQLTYYVYDQQLKDDPAAYYADKTGLFYKRDTVQAFSESSIYKEQKILLESIRAILKKHNTDYKIIINPLYDQIKISEKDLDYLKGLFGAEHVFDFSGINDFTKPVTNYYEPSHFRPFVCDSILHLVYK